MTRAEQTKNPAQFSYVAKKKQRTIAFTTPDRNLHSAAWDFNLTRERNNAMITLQYNIFINSMKY